MKIKIFDPLKIQFLVFLAVFFMGNLLFAQQPTRTFIDVTLNGASSDDDYLECWYGSEFLRDIRGAATLSVFTGKSIKIIAHGGFKDWSGSSCGGGSGEILKFEITGDCIVTANFGASDDTDRRR